MIVTKQYFPEQDLALSCMYQILADLGLDSRSPQTEIVGFQFDSPYQFGDDMRRSIGDEWTAVFMLGGVYVCINYETFEVAFLRSTIIGAASLDVVLTTGGVIFD